MDQRTDLYSAGAVLFECVTGRVVYELHSLGELAAVHLRQAPPDPSTFNPAISRELSSVILRALAHRPADRWQSAAELLHALETCVTPSAAKGA